MLNVLLTTAMFVGGCVAFILDNTIPGTWYTLNMLVAYVNYLFCEVNTEAGRVNQFKALPGSNCLF